MTLRQRQGLRRLDPAALRGVPRAADLRALRRRPGATRVAARRRRACSRSRPAPASSRARLAAALPERRAIVATDLNPGMLEHARAGRHGAAGRVAARPTRCSCRSTTASFDAVVCQFGVMFFPDKGAGVRRGAPRAAPGRRVPVQRLGPDRGQRIRRRRDARAGDAVPRRSAALHGAHAARLPRPRGDRARPRRAAASDGAAQIETVAARSRAPSPRHPAIAYCQGTPLRSEIEARDAARLGEATDVAAAAIARRFGAGAVDGKIQAHVVIVER